MGDNKTFNQMKSIQPQVSNIICINYFLQKEKKNWKCKQIVPSSSSILYQFPQEKNTHAYNGQAVKQI